VQQIRIIDQNGRILTSSNPAECGRISPVSEQLALSLQKKGPLRISGQEGALLAAYPIYNSSICKRCHKTGGMNLGLISLTFPSGNAGLLTGNTANSITSSLLIFLLLSATLLLFSPFVLQAARRRLAINSDKFRNRGDNIHATTINNNRISMAGEKAQHHFCTNGKTNCINGTDDEEICAPGCMAKTSRISDGRSRQAGKFRKFSIHRFAAADKSGTPDSRLAFRLNNKNKTNSNTLQRLGAVHKISLATSSAMELEEVFHNLLDITINTLGSEVGYILQYDHENELFRVRSFLSCYGKSPNHEEIPCTPGNVSALVYKTRKPVLIRDINDTPQFGRRSALGYERRSLICVPLIVQNEIIGTMAVVNKIDNSLYNSEDMKFLSTIASQAGLAIKNAKLREEQQKAYMNIVHALVSIIDASDSYTKGHSDRVTFYSVELARKINLPQEKIDIIERAAILHDIGKIGINAYLLNKEMQLSPEETDKLRQHPLIGMKILDPLDFLRDVSTCIGQHHERVDGTGYPHGIPGEKILLESQILAIADAYDAMTSDRPYRRALSSAEAIKELEENAGKQHNLELVRHFVELHDSGRLDITARKPAIISSSFLDFEHEPEFFTNLSDRRLMPSMDEYPQSNSCPSR
jgi:putative nucleotidyltransferase with HDIG domain